MYNILNNLIGILPQRYEFIIPICVSILLLLIISIFIKVILQ